MSQGADKKSRKGVRFNSEEEKQKSSSQVIRSQDGDEDADEESKESAKDKKSPKKEEKKDVKSYMKEKDAKKDSKESEKKDEGAGDEKQSKEDPPPNPQWKYKDYIQDKKALLLDRIMYSEGVKKKNDEEWLSKIRNRKGRQCFLTGTNSINVLPPYSKYFEGALPPQFKFHPERVMLLAFKHEAAKRKIRFGFKFNPEREPKPYPPPPPTKYPFWMKKRVNESKRICNCGARMRVGYVPNYFPSPCLCQDEDYWCGCYQPKYQVGDKMYVTCPECETCGYFCNNPDYLGMCNDYFDCEKDEGEGDDCYYYDTCECTEEGTEEGTDVDETPNNQNSPPYRKSRSESREMYGRRSYEGAGQPEPNPDQNVQRTRNESMGEEKDLWSPSIQFQVDANTYLAMRK